MNNEQYKQALDTGCLMIERGAVLHAATADGVGIICIPYMTDQVIERVMNDSLLGNIAKKVRKAMEGIDRAPLRAIDSLKKSRQWAERFNADAEAQNRVETACRKLLQEHGCTAGRLQSCSAHGEFEGIGLECMFAGRI